MITRLLGVALTVLAVGLASCGDSGSGGGSGPSGSASGAGKTKVGLLVVGTTSDGGWNQQAKEALDKIAGPENLDVRVRQGVKQDGAADAIRQFDSQGYALVIAHGYEYLQAAKELTDPAKNPGGAVKVKIAVSGGDVDNPNFQSLLYDLEGASYQLGIIAAKVSKSGKLGFIGGAKFPTVVAMQRGFQAGAKSVNPNATFAEAWPGWDDPSKAKREAEAFMAQGVDVIMQNVDAASRGVFEAIKEHNAQAKEKPVYTFGANSDQNDNPVCSDYTLASAVIKMDKAFDGPVKQVKAGTFKGGLVKEDLASGVSVAVLNPKLVGKVIDAETQKLVDEAAKKIADGSVTISK
jgi:basic membrane protein A